MLCGGCSPQCWAALSWVQLNEEVEEERQKHLFLPSWGSHMSQLPNADGKFTCKKWSLLWSSVSWVCFASQVSIRGAAHGASALRNTLCKRAAGRHQVCTHLPSAAIHPISLHLPVIAWVSHLPLCTPLSPRSPPHQRGGAASSRGEDGMDSVGGGVRRQEYECSTVPCFKNTWTTL